MSAKTIDSLAHEAKTDAVVIGIFSDQPSTGAAAAIDSALGGVVTRVIEAKEIEGKPEQTLALHQPAGVASPLVLLVGLGPKDKTCIAKKRTATRLPIYNLPARRRRRSTRAWPLASR